MTISISATGAAVAAAGTNPVTLGVATGAVISGVTKLLSSGAGPAAAAAIGVSTSVSAILAALTTKTVGGSVVGALSGAGSSTAAAWIAGVASGPLGGIILGTVEERVQELDKSENTPIQYSFDCWKKVLREEDSEESGGKPLRDVLCDERVKLISFSGDLGTDQLPEIKVTNIWSDNFQINFMILPQMENLLTAHATPVN